MSPPEKAARQRRLPQSEDLSPKSTGSLRHTVPDLTQLEDSELQTAAGVQATEHEATREEGSSSELDSEFCFEQNAELGLSKLEAEARAGYVLDADIQQEILSVYVLLLVPGYKAHSTANLNTLEGLLMEDLQEQFKQAYQECFFEFRAQPGQLMDHLRVAVRARCAATVDGQESRSIELRVPEGDTLPDSVPEPRLIKQLANGGTRKKPAAARPAHEQQQPRFAGGPLAESRPSWTARTAAAALQQSSRVPAGACLYTRKQSPGPGTHACKHEVGQARLLFLSECVWVLTSEACSMQTIRPCETCHASCSAPMRTWLGLWNCIFTRT